MKKSRKDFIKKAHSAACNEWKTNIEAEFPKLFKKDDLVVGKWYKSDWGYKFCFNGEYDIDSDPRGYGFSQCGEFLTDNKTSKRGGWGKYNITEATDEEVEKALIKEAKKKDYKNVNINNLETIGNMLSSHHSIASSKCYYYNSIENALWFRGKLIFWNGKWATIITETITKEQAEKELGKTILN